MDDNQNYCNDRFVVYTNIKYVCCISEIDIRLYVNYTSIKKGYWSISYIDNEELQYPFFLFCLSPSLV